MSTLKTSFNLPKKLVDIAGLKYKKTTIPIHKAILIKLHFIKLINRVLNNDFLLNKIMMGSSNQKVIASILKKTATMMQICQKNASANRFFL